MGFTVVCALLFAWIAYSVRWIESRRQFRTAHDEARVRGIPAKEQNAPGWLWLFGERPTLGWASEDLTEGEIAEAQQLFPEAQIIGPANP